MDPVAVNLCPGVYLERDPQTDRRIQDNAAGEEPRT